MKVAYETMVSCCAPSVSWGLPLSEHFAVVGPGVCGCGHHPLTGYALLHIPTGYHVGKEFPDAEAAAAALAHFPDVDWGAFTERNTVPPEVARPTVDAIKRFGGVL